MNGDLQDSDGIDIGGKHKLGHLRVDTQGNATFKHLPTNQLVESLQLGIQYSVGSLEATPAHDVLFQDFPTVEIIHFPKSGSMTPKPTPPHRFNDFTMRSYAPIAFRHFREKFNIKPEDYLSSINKPFRELKNPGASGSLFYLTADDEFIIKTVQKKEADFLKRLLPGYYMNIIQNKRTLLPKFFGLYCYQVTEFLLRNKASIGDNKNIRITVMNNLIPSSVQMHEKYDLKGSTFKRRANEVERQKESPTWKDLDFMERHPQGLILSADTFNALQKTVQRDCRVLESFHIMDYSFLIGIHQVDTMLESSGDFTTPSGSTNTQTNPFNRQVSVISQGATPPKPKRMMYSTPMDTIHAEFDESNKPDDYLVKTGGIPARTANGQRLSLYVGIIDILQSYEIRKKLEHTFKSVMTDGAQISVTNPTFYSGRFQKFLFTTVFKKAPQRASRIPTVDALSPWTDRGIGPPYAFPSHPNYGKSNASPHTATSNSSHVTLNYTSSDSSRRTDIRTQHGSETTFYGSSQQSDSLFNEPTLKGSGRIETTSFNQDRKRHSRLKHYRDLSASTKTTTDKRQDSSDIDRRKLPLSTTDLSSGNYLSDYSPNDRQQNHQSSDEITRL